MKIFKNSNNQLRSGWKIGIVLLASILFELTLETVILIWYIAKNGITSPDIMENELVELLTNNLYIQCIFQGLTLLALFLILFIAFHSFDKKKFKNIGFSAKNHIKELIFGLFLGAISMTSIFFILYFTGNVGLNNSLSDPNISTSILIGLVMFIFVGIKEELLSRGYCITALNQMKKPWLSAVISSAMFSCLHLLNPNVRLMGLINIFLVGMLFAYMYIKTDNLMMPIGYHITWNYFQGNVFGFNVSGNNAAGIYSVNILKDNILTGGSFGPEAGILTTIVIALGIVVVWRFYGKKEVVDEKVMIND